MSFFPLFSNFLMCIGKSFRYKKGGWREPCKDHVSDLSSTRLVYFWYML